MPCVSDYQEPTAAEVEHSKVLALLQELKTGKLPKYYGDGTYKEVYNKTNTIGDEAERPLDIKTRELCTALKTKTADEIKGYSLEMQLWWREHQKADKKRAAKSKGATKTNRIKKQALAKLTAEERKVLGV